MRSLVTIQQFISELVEKARLAKLAAQERGASAVEYALLIALIAAVIVVAVYILGHFVSTTFTNTCNAIASEGSKAAGVGSCSSS